MMNEQAAGERRPAAQNTLTCMTCSASIMQGAAEEAVTNYGKAVPVVELIASRTRSSCRVPELATAMVLWKPGCTMSMYTPTTLLVFLAVAMASDSVATCNVAAHVGAAYFGKVQWLRPLTPDDQASCTCFDVFSSYYICYRYRYININPKYRFLSAFMTDINNIVVLCKATSRLSCTASHLKLPIVALVSACACCLIDR